jgi:hypothetical protein
MAGNLVLGGGSDWVFRYWHPLKLVVYCLKWDIPTKGEREYGSNNYRFHIEENEKASGKFKDSR